MKSFSVGCYAIFCLLFSSLTSAVQSAVAANEQSIVASNAQQNNLNNQASALIVAVQPMLGDQHTWQWPLESGFPHIAAQGLRFKLLTKTDDELTWQSSSPQIASVDENGIVTLHQAGQVTIQVSDGQQTQNFVINPALWLTVSDGQLRNWQQANQYCQAHDMQLPDIASLTSAEWASPATKRQVNHFWDEWGNLTVSVNQGGAGWLNGLYWSRTAFAENQYYAVELLGGGRFSQPAQMNLFVVCQSDQSIKPSPLITGISALNQQRSAITPATNLAMGYPYSGYPGAQLQLYVRRQGEHQWQWQSSDPQRATIDAKGVVTLHQPGKVTLTLRDNLHKQFDQYQLNITKWYQLIDDNAYSAKEAAQLCQTKHQQLTRLADWQSRNGVRSFFDEWGLPASWPSLANKGAKQATGYWTIDRNSLVIVNQPHLQVPNANQQAYVVCRDRGSSPALSAIQVGQTRWKLDSGFPQTAFAGAKFRLLLDNADQAVRWSSNDQQIASVSAQGEVTLHQAGPVTIYVNRYQDNQIAYPINIKQWFIIANSTDKSDIVTKEGDIKLTPQKMSWSQAHAYCQQHQAQLPSIGQLTSAALLAKVSAPKLGHLWDEWQPVLAQRPDVMPQLWSNRSRQNNNHDVLSVVDGHYGSASDNLLLGTVCLQAVTSRNIF